MPFPPAERVLYRKNPLDQVVCQVRFPPILRIDADLPADFQDRVRGEFPNFTQTSEFKIEIPPGIGDQVPAELLRQVLQSSGGKNYEFSSADGAWKVNLTRTFIALSTTAYRRWEEFRDRLSLPLQCLNAIYAPSDYSRLGLRYIDVIKRSVLGLGDVSWRDLLSPTLIGMLGSPETADSVESLESMHRIRLADNGGSARITAKLLESPDHQDVWFVIDGDFFDTSHTATSAAIEKLNFLNSRSSRFIRWAISPRLHTAMEPEPL
jgi:uncharacterized protein (TIGR04255 family)